MFDPFSRLTKIGKSFNPKQRLSIFKTANPNIELIYFTKDFTEEYLHKKYEDKRVAYEWFKLNKNDFLYISKGENKIIPKRMCYKNTQKDLLVDKYMNKKKNNIIVINELKYQFKLCDYIQFTSDLKKVFNFQSGNEITTENNMKKGFWHKRKFYQLSKIKDMIELIPKYEFQKNILTEL